MARYGHGHRQLSHGAVMNILVVVPTHDRTTFMDDAVISVLQQTRKADKIVVTGNVLPDKYPGVEYELSDAPLQERVNKAIEESDCDAYTLLCDDDKLKSTFIERTSHLLETSKADIVYTDYDFFGDRRGLEYAHIVPVTNLCTRDMWQRAGKYRAGFYFDWDFWWCCADAGLKVAPIHEPLWWYRSHPGQDGRQETDQMRLDHIASVMARHTTKPPYYQ
jgi:hypothetical protein